MKQICRNRHFQNSVMMVGFVMTTLFIVPMSRSTSFIAALESLGLGYGGILLMYAALRLRYTL